MESHMIAFREQDLILNGNILAEVKSLTECQMRGMMKDWHFPGIKVLAISIIVR